MEYDANAIRQNIRVAALALIDATELLTDIDNRSGDGDLGLSMSQGARSILAQLDAPCDTVVDLFKNCSAIINEDAPSTMGTLISVALYEAAAYLELENVGETVSDGQMLELPGVMARAIMFYGNARRGDKTVLDALIPFANALKQDHHKTHDINGAFKSANAAVIEATLETRGMVAKVGRAKWIGALSRFCQDGGATVCAIIVNAIATGDYASLRERFESCYTLAGV